MIQILLIITTLSCWHFLGEKPVPISTDNVLATCEYVDPDGKVFLIVDAKPIGTRVQLEPQVHLKPIETGTQVQ